MTLFSGLHVFSFSKPSCFLQGRELFELIIVQPAQEKCCAPLSRHAPFSEDIPHLRSRFLTQKPTKLRYGFTTAWPTVGLHQKLSKDMNGVPTSLGCFSVSQVLQYKLLLRASVAVVVLEERQLNALGDVIRMNYRSTTNVYDGLKNLSPYHRGGLFVVIMHYW